MSFHTQSHPYSCHCHSVLYQDGCKALHRTTFTGVQVAAAPYWERWDYIASGWGCHTCKTFPHTQNSD